MKIKLLDASVANKIAAGEVVERPSSIVKELVENSIDAGATNVTVEIKGGGIDLIRITDNGCGMAEEDVKNAFLRHATSKISVAEDLNDILTLGFRGEALASVAAVSKIALTTRTKNSVEGTQIELTGGVIDRFFPCGCAEGTNITVCDLFFNTPARRKFLKRPSQEASYIQEAINRLALSNPQIAIRFISEGKTVLRTPGDNNLLSAIRAIFGQEISVNMIPVEETRNGITLSGFIGKREIQRNNRSRQILFINGRSVKNDLVSSAIQQGYAGRLNIGKFPFFILEMKLKGNLVDVNVHPTKQEVRFQDGLPVYETVSSIINEVLLKNQEIPTLYNQEQKAEEKKVFEVETVNPRAVPEEDIIRTEKINFSDAIKEIAKAFEETPIQVNDKPFTPITNIIKGLEAEKADTVIEKTSDTVKETVYKEPQKEIIQINEIKEQAIEAPATKTEHVIVQEAITKAPVEEAPKEQMTLPEAIQTELEIETEEQYKISGVLFDTYIIVESGDEAYIIDQHAAHERLLFERLFAQMEDGATSQLLLIPQIIKLSPQESALIEELMPKIEEMGFIIDDMGFGSLAVKAVPDVLSDLNAEKFLTSLCEENIKNLKTNELKRAKLMQMACKSAIKGGDKLTDGDIKKLLKLIKEEGIPLSCPHGRPILVCLTKHELEVRFKRVQ